MKQKTVKTTQKRFNKTASGKLMRRGLSAQHLTSGKSKRVLKNRDKMQELSSADNKRIKRMLPNYN